jgi:hypothetical protein
MSEGRPRHRGRPGRRTRHRRRWAILVLGAATAGCGPTILYDWGRYEDSLQASYVGHDEARAWSSLEETIVLAQQSGHRLPPGACAEYAFALYKRGQHGRAIEYFEREAQLFPESKPLMDKLIARVRERAPEAGAPPPDSHP